MSNPVATIGKLTRDETQQRLADVIQEVDILITFGEVTSIERQVLVRSADHLLVAGRARPVQVKG